jgi:hypothetical protein
MSVQTGRLHVVGDGLRHESVDGFPGLYTRADLGGRHLDTTRGDPRERHDLPTVTAARIARRPRQHDDLGERRDTFRVSPGRDLTGQIFADEQKTPRSRVSTRQRVERLDRVR